jgi:signal transduction histidine kinase
MVIGAVGFAGIGAVAGRMHDLATNVSKHTSDLQRELTQRQEYTDVVAHEMRNPLVAIRAAARAAQRDETDATMAQRLGAIADEAGRALGLLDGLNDVANIESGRMRSVLRPVDIASTVRDTVASLGEAAARVKVSAPGELLVSADGERIEQVVGNLLGNAVKYTPAGSPIEVTVALSSDAECAVVKIRDHGPGVPPEERHRLFEKFARLSTAGGTSGSGLGLYISRGIVQDHKGELRVEWPADGGTLFTFTLPRVSDRRARQR